MFAWLFGNSFHVIDFIILSIYGGLGCPATVFAPRNSLAAWISRVNHGALGSERNSFRLSDREIMLCACVCVCLCAGAPAGIHRVHKHAIAERVSHACRVVMAIGWLALCMTGRIKYTFQLVARPRVPYEHWAHTSVRIFRASADTKYTSTMWCGRSIKIQKSN